MFLVSLVLLAVLLAAWLDLFKQAAQSQTATQAGMFLVAVLLPPVILVLLAAWWDLKQVATQLLTVMQ